MAEDEQPARNGVHYTPREMFDEIRRDIAALRGEIRTDRHDLSNKLATLTLRVDRLEYQQSDDHRRFASIDQQAAKYIPIVEQLREHDTVAAQIKGHGLTTRQLMLAYGLFVFAFVGAVGTVVSIGVLLTGAGGNG